MPSFIRAAGQVAQCVRQGLCPVRGTGVGREHPSRAGQHQTPSAVPQHSQAHWNLQPGLHRLQSCPEKRGDREGRTGMDENPSPR